MRVDVMTLFPGLFEGFLTQGIVRLARAKGLLEVALHDFRDFATDTHRSVDDRPYGGGPGMVLSCGPVFSCDESIVAAARAAGREGEPRRVMLSPQGRRLDQALLEELASEPWLLFLCGHYEGFDERIRVGLRPLEVSIGDYVLSGGEVPAMVLIDGMTRLLPGALGAPDGARNDSFACGQLLEGPQYTRPRVFRGMEVPQVLLSGDHGAVARWRLQQAVERTRARRPDLLEEGRAGRVEGHEEPER
ncbi:MAG: tRNA (guanosine(37)-N1)-methyltransferase TrmD [Planctomycetota bacterium]